MLVVFRRRKRCQVVRLAAIFLGGVGMKEFHPTKWWGFGIEVSVFERWVE